MEKVTTASNYATLRAQSKRMDSMDRNIMALDNKVDHVRNRLPVWATILITLLGSIVTGLTTYAVVI